MLLRRAGWVLYFLGSAFAWAGFASWRSDSPQVFRWSLNYGGLLVAMLALLAVPPLLAWLARRVGRRKFLFGIAPAVGLVGIAYAGGAAYHYLWRTYPFDPFLQVPPPEMPSTGVGAGSYRILAIGGSTTREHRLPEPARYPTVLERLLREREPGLHPIVFNAGMDWFTTKHSLIDYVTRLREWHPRTIVVLHGINDLYRSCAPPQFVVPPNTAYKPDWSHFYGPAVNGARPPSFERFLYDRFFVELGRKWWADWRYVERDYPLEHWLALPEYRVHLRQLVHYLRSDGADVILVTQPSLLKADPTFAERRALIFGQAFCETSVNPWRSDIPSPATFARALEAFNDATREIARELSTALVDAERAIPKDLTHFRDDVHFRAAGAAKVADLVATEIARSLPRR